MHLLDAVPVHQSLCNFMKRTLAMVSLVYQHALTFIHFHTFLVGCFGAGLHNSCRDSRIDSSFSFLPRYFSCIMSMALGNHNDAMS